MYSARTDSFKRMLGSRHSRTRLEQQIAVLEALVPQYLAAPPQVDPPPKDRAVVDTRMKLSPFAARIDPGWEVGQ